MNQQQDDQAAQDPLQQLAAAQQADAGADGLHAAPPESGNIFAQSAQLPRTGGNLILSLIGAAGGASIGAGLWFLVEYFLNHQVGLIAILSGALAGWGAVALGGRRSALVGIIAALAGVGGIIGGSYASYKLTLHSDEVRAEVREELNKLLATNPETANLTRAEKDAVSEQMYEEMLKTLTYFEVYKQNPGDLAWIGLFGLLGLYYGYRVGAGPGAKLHQAAA